MIDNLFYDKKVNKYYFTGLPLCSLCKKIEHKIIFVERSFSKKEKTIQLFCKKCIGISQSLPVRFDETLLCLCIDTEKLPDNCFPVFESIPILSNFKGDDTIFSMAQKSRDGEKVNDLAIQSHNPNFMIQDDAKNPEQISHDIKEKDRKQLFSGSDIDDLLSDYKNADAFNSMEELEDKTDNDTKRLK